MKKGHFALKTNPLQYFYPEYNLSLELGTGDLRSWELKAAFFPFLDYRRSDRRDMLTAQGSGFSAHLMRRHYQKANPSLFMSYGILFRRWSYEDLFRIVTTLPPGDFTFIREDRTATTAGLKYLIGKRSTFLKGKGLIEVYAGLSMKLRFDAVSWQYENGIPCPAGICNLSVAGEVTPVPGFNLGINIGPNFGGSAKN